MDLIIEYIASVTTIDETDYANKKSVKQHNKLADRLRVIAFEIEHTHPEMKQRFYDLLSHEKATVRLWVAHHILEVMNYDNVCREKALKEISYVSENNDGVDGIGNRMWLEHWLNEHLSDRDLLKI